MIPPLVGGGIRNCDGGDDVDDDDDEAGTIEFCPILDIEKETTKDKKTIQNFVRIWFNVYVFVCERGSRKSDRFIERKGNEGKNCFHFKFPFVF